MELRSVVVLHAQTERRQRESLASQEVASTSQEETPDSQQKLKLVMNALVLADSTGGGKISGRRTQSVIGDDGVFHIISPDSSLSSPGYAKNQRSLAHALAVETHPQLSQALTEVKEMKVVFINPSDSVMSKQKQHQYEQMKLHCEALQLLETCSTIMSLQLSCVLCGSFVLFLVWVAQCFG